jgi:hypothetical protein
MGEPESRRIPRITLSPLPGSDPAPTGRKISRRPTGKTSRRIATEAAPDPAAPAAFAAEEARAKRQLGLYAAVGGGALLLILVIAIAASSGPSKRLPAADAAVARPARRTAEPPPPPPRESPRQYNFVRNVGSIVFVCAGTDRHPDKEVVLSACPKCPARNAFAWDEGAYRCSACKSEYENAAIKCDQCDRAPRVTHLKKVAAGP